MLDSMLDQPLPDTPRYGKAGGKSRPDRSSPYDGPPKICHNCGGRGHIAKDCPSEQVCSCCGRAGHKKADCEMATKMCDVCGKFGHLKAMCQSKGAGKNGKGFGKCYCCGSEEHKKEECPQKTKVCDICGKVGHLKFMCESGGVKGAVSSTIFVGGKGAGCYCCGSPHHQKIECLKRDKVCDICGKVGHLKSMCDSTKGGGTWVWARGDQGGGEKPCYCCGNTDHQKIDCPMRDKVCDICGKVGHLKSMCDSTKGGGKGGGEKPCYCCGKTDHQKIDCPMRDKVCDICGKFGHLKAMCESGGKSGGGKGKGKLAGCFCCGDYAHQKIDCPHASKECNSCGKIGHLRHMCES